jgi:hypothetical protein
MMNEQPSDGRLKDLKYVIVSYECNFWGMAALAALIESLDAAEAASTVYVVHNGKKTAQIDYFNRYFQDVETLSEVIHVLAYEGLFLQVENCFDFPHRPSQAFLASHPMILNWLR